MFGWGWHWDYMGAGLVGLALWLVLAVVIVWLIVRVVAGPQSRRGYGPPPPRSDPEQVLRDRFARGEIDAEEFEHRLEVLRRTTPPGG